MSPHRKEEMIIWGSVIGGVVILYVVFLPRHTTSPPSQRGVPNKVPSSHPTTMPNPQQGTVDQALIQARAEAIAMFDQTVLGEKTSQDQLTAANNEIQAQKVIAFNQDATQLKELGMTIPAAELIAHEQVGLQENLMSQYTSAIGQQEHAQQQQSLWGSILGGLGSIFSFLGFNNPFLNPVGSGTGYVDTGTGLPYDQYGAMGIPPSSYDIPPVILPTTYYGG